MATTKTIQPTGETITIPAMTDRPDASVFSTDVSRITDAVNSQNQALANKADNYYDNSTGSASSLGVAINTALKNIGAVAVGKEFSFTFTLNAVMYFGFACYSLSKVSFGRIFNRENVQIGVFRNSLDDSAASVTLHEFVPKSELPAFHFQQIGKSTGASSATITFTKTAGDNRYTGLLFVTQNSGESGIYALAYKSGAVNSVEKLSGNAPTPSINISNGNVTVTIGAYGRATLLVDNADGTFT